MNPYYQDDAVTLYHADCREVLPTLGRFDLLLTDPPYNVGKDYGTHNDAMSEEEYAEWCKSIMAVCVCDRQFVVAPRYKLGLWLSLLNNPHMVVIRRGACGPFRQGWSDQFQIALAVGKPLKCVPDLWDDIRLKGEGYFFREESYGHPGYTPAPIFARAIDIYTKPGNTIVEPFAGTGTALRVAKDMGRKAIGIEIEEKYCEIAAKRMAQEVLF